MGLPKGPKTLGMIIPVKIPPLFFAQFANKERPNFLDFPYKLSRSSWEDPAKDLPKSEYILSAENLDILHIPKGFITSIKAIEERSKLLVFADYDLGEVNDEYRFPTDYFNEK